MSAIEYDSASDTYQAHTRRYERERGFTRGCFVVVPSWEPIYPLDTYDDSIAARFARESARDLEYAHVRMQGRTTI